MEKIKKLLSIFVVDTLVMLVSWAGLSLILLGVRVFSGSQVALIRMLSVYSFFIVMFCYAFYLAFDLSKCLSIEIRVEKMKVQTSAEPEKGHLEPKLLLRFVYTRVIKVIAAGLIFTLVSWLLLLQEYVWGFFLLGASLGFLFFWIFGFLKHQLGYREIKGSSAVSADVGRLVDPPEIRSNSSVKD